MERAVMNTVNVIRYCALLCVCCFAADQAAARTLQAIRNAGELRVAIALASPWAMRDREGFNCR